MNLIFHHIAKHHDGSFCTLREKIVLDLTLKVIQVQQRDVLSALVTPNLPGLTPPVSPPVI